MQNIARALSACGLILAVALAGCGDSGNPVKPCGPTNCQGCCQAGNCIVTASTAACGLGGATCIACASGESCSAGNCKKETTTCSVANCPTGCCQGNTCMPGNTISACGKGAGACAACTSTQTCTSNACVAVTKPCGATTCATGCCYNSQCMPGDNPGVCGTGGIQCVTCKSGEQCPAAQKKCVTVQCNASTCGTGCCDKNGNCVQGTSEAACGTGGAGCATCTTSQICKTGSCQGVTPTCNATLCPNGCCDSTGACQPGNTSAACGKSAAACAKCGTSQECASNVCSCTPTSCPTGCCSNNQCQPGTADMLCGKGGVACKACNTAGGEKCTQQTCSKTCAWPGCAGCCNSSNTCVAGNDPSACGISGMACQQCGGTDGCYGGTCNNASQCGSSGTDKCTSGCCKGGSCQAGTSDLACGAYGDVCVFCAPHMTCDSTYKECRIKPTAKLDVILVSAEIDTAKGYDGGLEFNDAPDVYVELTIGAQTKKSKTVNDDYNPVFNEYLMTSTASDLLGTIKLKVWDYDMFTSDDGIADCQQTFYEDELTSGSSVIYFPCTGNSDLKSISFKFSPAP